MTDTKLIAEITGGTVAGLITTIVIVKLISKKRIEKKKKRIYNK